MRLTVAIPTYDRNESLRQTLEHLLPQLNDRCELLILDNHSVVPVEETLLDLLAAYPEVEYRIVRHPLNLGATANFMRCFELCETEWIWLLGDDDCPSPDAVSTVLRNLDARPNCTFFNFTTSRSRRERSVNTTGLREFVSAIDSWSLLLFMSVGVYHCPSILPNLRFGYLFAYSLAPHVALVLCSLGDDGECCFSQEPIICQQAPAEWSAVNALLGKMILLDLPMEDDVRRELARKLRRRPSLEVVTILLVKTARENGRWREAVYQYDQICARVYRHDRWFLTAPRIFAYRFLIRFYRAGYWILRVCTPLIARIMGFNCSRVENVAVGSFFQRV